MTHTDVEDRLLHLGQHLDEERRAREGEAVRATSPMSGDRMARPFRRRGVAIAGIAAMVVAAVAVVITTAASDDDTDLAATAGSVPGAVPEDVPSPGELVPLVEAPPDWFGAPVAARRDGGQRTGRWTSMAIGVDDGEGIASPIWLGVTDGTMHGLSEATAVDIDGEEYRTFGHGGWNALVVDGPLTAVASGAVDLPTLAAVLAAATYGHTPDGLSLRLDELPRGYREVVPAQRHAEDVVHRRTVASADAATGVNEVSDWVNPELAAAASGADYDRVTRDGIEAWTGETSFNGAGPLRFLIFSPSPGVVVDITTTDRDRTVDDLLVLAQSVEVFTPDEWDARLPTG